MFLQVKNITSLDNTTKLVHYVTLEKEAAWYPGIYAGAVGLVVLLSIFRSYFFMKVGALYVVIHVEEFFMKRNT
jgi:uncharacterized protein YdeI (YjbR/CyaY-like superfamily)